MAAAPLTLSGISSMATRLLLSDLAQAWQAQAGHTLQVEAVGGVDAARRVAAGESFDAVFLASDAIDKLIASGAVVAGSRVDLVRSPVAVAVREGAASPDIASEAALKAAVLAADRISFSTGPSGVYLTTLFERWGIAAQIASRLVQAPPGVPVGSLVARGEVDLGFQQLSELMHLKGIRVVGPLPPEVQFITTFSGALCATSSQGSVVREMLAWMASAATAEAKRRQGMDPA
jgi:molybdate transport system substrate-binding protein